MKRNLSNTIKILLVVLLLIGTFTACTGNDDNTKLKIGTYALVHEKVELTSALELSKNNQFIFTVSPLNSYLSVGTFKVEGDKLICQTDDGKYTIVFKIYENYLQINFDKSTNVEELISGVDGSPVKNGSKFTFVQE